MSLRFRLNLLVSLLSLAILALGAWMVIHNARRAVFEEVQSTASLTLQLLDVAAAVPADAAAPDLRSRVLARLDGLDEIRHLRIVLAENGTERPLAGIVRSEERIDAPAWFERLVEPPPMEFRLPIPAAATETPTAEIVVRTDSTDEIAEAWTDARVLLGLVLGFAVVANAAFFVAVGRWLRPLDHVVAALERIEHGNYSARLPAFDLPELSVLSDKFNHMAEKLERSRDENRELTRRSLAIQENERRHLAQELHDELGQSISAIKAVAVTIGKGSGARDGDVERASATIADIATDVYSVVTRLIRRLRPLRLDEFGLVPALEELVDGWNERHPDAFCSLTAHGRFDDLGEALEIGIYRIVQESLTNASKHSRANDVRILLERAEETLRLEIRDDGIGFDPNRTRSGLGLLGMRERTDALGGTFDVEAAPDAGVAIRVAVPLRSNAIATT